MVNTYFSGQGIIYLAKSVDRNIVGTFKELGNCPEFFFTKDGDIHIVTEEFTLDTFNLVFGGRIERVAKTDIPSVGTFQERYADANLYKTPIKSKVDDVYHLVFEGYNTACNNQPVRIELSEISFKSADKVDLITDNLTSFKLKGSYNTKAKGNSAYWYEIPRK